MYAAPSRLQVNDAGSLAVKENSAESLSGNSLDRLVCGGVWSSGVVDVVDALTLGDGLAEGAAVPAPGAPDRGSSVDGRPEPAVVVGTGAPGAWD